MKLTLDQLQRIMPYSAGRAALFLDPINAAMDEFSIVTPRQQAAFLAQVAHESGELRYTLEIADGTAYEGRHDLGNVEPGDGPRFKGRGLLQATGRAVYTKLAAALSIDCVANPSLLEIASGAARSAAWIWSVDKGLNELADADRFETITHRINGGFNGLKQRTDYWCRARGILGV